MNLELDGPLGATSLDRMSSNAHTSQWTFTSKYQQITHQLDMNPRELYAMPGLSLILRFTAL